MFDGAPNLGTELFRWIKMYNNYHFRPVLYIPPGGLYTSFEKISLPFDRETWIGLLITFISGTITIFIINRFSEKLRIIFYGNSRHASIFDIFRTFFGIPENISPNGNFARIILISFVLWCLVVRTAYQGKLFEFTTTAVRKPEMRSLEELRSRNFTLFFCDESADVKKTEIVTEIVG